MYVWLCSWAGTLSFRFLGMIGEDKGRPRHENIPSVPFYHPPTSLLLERWELDPGTKPPGSKFVQVCSDETFELAQHLLESFP